MPYTIVTDICEGIADCIPVCPVECIDLVEDKPNAKGTKYAFVKWDICIDCGACLAACPIEGAVLDEQVEGVQVIPA
ncbi:MAG: 4Fe-4S dicluster domain-containing protein [Candidatus Caenarcaniphilales bacterium]|nr:4Fe-4S dicluster domain-containing protein [Candidatus Caenarcaniphilales bacterium]